MEFPFQTTYVPQHKDLLPVQRHATRYFVSTAQRYAIWIYLAPMAILIGASIAFLFREDVQIKLASFVGTFLAQWGPLIILVVTFRIFAGHIARWNQRRCTERLEKIAPHTEVALKVDEQQISWTTQHTGSWIQYPAIERLFLAPNALGIIYNGTISYLPIAVIGGEEDLKSLVTFIAQQISDEARDLSLQETSLKELIMP